MREILFRGKRKDSGEWVFGCYYKQSEFYGDEVDDHIIITSHEDLSFDQALEYCDVQAETVGQFTGMIDSTGNKVFEGDIIEAYTYKKRRKHRIFLSEVYYENGAFYIRFMEHGVALLSGLINSFNFEGEGIFSKVIGNIHDNSELLEGGVE